MDLKYLFAIITVIAVTIIQLFAFSQGIDGQVFAGCTGIITALIGYILGIEIKNKQNNTYLDQVYQKLSEIFNKLQ